MTTILSPILALVGMMLIGLIMLQHGNADALAGFNENARAVQGVANPIRRATAWMAAIFFMLAIALGIFNRPKNLPTFEEDSNKLEAAAPVLTPAVTPPNTPAPAPTINPPAPVVPPVTPKVEVKPTT